MKVSVTKENLLSAVSRAEKITGKNLSLAVLKCALFLASDNELKIRSTNLDMGIEIGVPAKVQEDGIVALPADVLNKLLSSMSSEGLITLDAKEGNVSVRSNNSESLVKALSHEDFPSLPVPKGGSKFSISAEALSRGFRSVWFSAAMSSIKPELSSVYLHSDGKSLMFVAADPFRLAEKKIVLNKKQIFEPLLIPLKNIGELIRNFEEVAGDVDMIATENQISFTFENTFITSRLIDGTFPDYKQIVPKKHETEAIVLKDDLVRSLKLANIFSNAFNQVGFRVHPNESEFRIETSNSDVGENNVQTDATLKGEGIDINVNHKYFSEVFQSINSDSLSIKFDGPGRPIVVSGVGDDSFTYIVMPMNK